MKDHYVWVEVYLASQPLHNVSDYPGGGWGMQISICSQIHSEFSFKSSKETFREGKEAKWHNH